MAVTEIGLCNSALLQLSQTSILSFEDGTQVSDACREEFPKARDTVLEAHPWNFATFTATLTRIADPPAWGYTFQYALPTEPYCLRVLNMQYNRPFEIGAYVHQGDPTRCLMTDEGVANVRYVGRVQDLSRWNNLAIEALTIFLGKVLAPFVTGQAARRQELLAELKAWIAASSDRDASEGTPQVLPPNRSLAFIRHRSSVRNPERTNGGAWW